jgi:hypothetical protein
MQRDVASARRHTTSSVYQNRIGTWQVGHFGAAARSELPAARRQTWQYQ